MSASPLRIGVPERGTVPCQPIRTPPAPNELHIELGAWRALAGTQADALIVGAGVAVLRVLTFIWPTLRKPVFWCESRRLSLPTRCEGTLVLEDAHALDADDQQRLLEWLRGGAESLRLIATSSHLLLPLVEEGKFSRELYERFAAVKLVIA
jgi:sigma-54-interacting transcriptional regulator